MQWPSWQKAFFWGGWVWALAPGHGTEMHRQQNTDNSTETRAQTSLCHTICICYISVISIVFHSLHALSLSCTVRLSEEVWCLVHHTLHWGIMSTHSHMPFPQNPHAMQLVFLEDNQPNSLDILSLSTSHAPSVACKNSEACSTVLILDSQDISQISLLFPFPCHSQNVLISSWLMRLTWVRYPWGSRFGRFPTGHKKLANSGRKPRLNLQWEIIERVFIHDQSLIQKVLGHLHRSKIL